MPAREWSRLLSVYLHLILRNRLAVGAQPVRSRAPLPCPVAWIGRVRAENLREGGRVVNASGHAHLAAAAVDETNMRAWFPILPSHGSSAFTASIAGPRNCLLKRSSPLWMFP